MIKINLKRLMSCMTMLLLCTVFVKAQPKNYKEYQVCMDSAIHKGKLNHGKYYCTAYATVIEYKDGRKDTVVWDLGGQIFIGDEYEKYEKLSERGKYIVDSLKEDGIPMFQDNYLTYEPIYMKPGKKTYKSWAIQGENVSVYYYSIWKNSKGQGIELMKEIVVE